MPNAMGFVASAVNNCIMAFVGSMIWLFPGSDSLDETISNNLWRFDGLIVATDTEDQRNPDLISELRTVRAL
ncbi:hypothetical protein SAMN05428947_110174 [Mucilaginibacter sp. OK283]|nr:hypothetical protein SAMN05428947_110174 [Mucilaginibacter sp. OK283]